MSNIVQRIMSNIKEVWGARKLSLNNSMKVWWQWQRIEHLKKEIEIVFKNGTLKSKKYNYWNKKLTGGAKHQTWDDRRKKQWIWR